MISFSKMTYFVIGVGGALAAVFAVFSQVHATDPSTPSPAPPTAKNERQPHYESAYERRVFHSPHGDDFAYGWLPPLHPEPGRKYPLVICLHGSGGSVKASSVLAREKMRADYPTFVMVGEAEDPFDWAATGVFAEKKRPEKLPVLLETVHALLTTEAIDPARIYITGQSLGGIGSWGAIARDPALFAAAVPVCGAWSVDDASKMAAVPRLGLPRRRRPDRPRPLLPRPHRRHHQSRRRRQIHRVPRRRAQQLAPGLRRAGNVGLALRPAQNRA
jgi:predicted peptidase